MPETTHRSPRRAPKREPRHRGLRAALASVALALSGSGGCAPADVRAPAEDARLYPESRRVPRASKDDLALQRAAPARIVAIGDLHGDRERTMRALRLAGAVDGEGNWSGGSLVVVQTGDQIMQVASNLRRY